VNNSNFVISNDNIFNAHNTRVHSIDTIVTSMVKHVDMSLANALVLKSKLPDSMTIHSLGVSSSVDDQGTVHFKTSSPVPVPVSERLIGFSGFAFRHFMNNLCNLKNANYLEVGVYRGATLISSIYGNESVMGEVHAVDNYSEFTDYSDPKAAYHKALDRYLPNTKDKIQFHEKDCFNLDLSILPKIDIYFYDGEHSAESQYRAFKYFEPIFADCFIAVVDDWEQRKVREGTKRAFEEINYDVVASRAVIPGMRPDNVSRIENPTLDWWCGTHVAVLRKRGSSE